MHDDAALFEEALLETAAEFSMSEEFVADIRPVQSFAGAFMEARDASLAKELGLLTFEVRANSLERTFADKVFAICDYYMSDDIPACQFRRIYDLHKLLGMVSLDDEMRSLMETVRDQRVGGYGNPSADDGVNLSVVLEEIVEKGPCNPTTSGSRCRCCTKTSPTTRQWLL